MHEDSFAGTIMREQIRRKETIHLSMSRIRTDAEEELLLAPFKF